MGRGTHCVQPGARRCGCAGRRCAVAYREHAGDAELAEVLVESATSEHGRLSLGFFNISDTPGPCVLLGGDAQQVSSTTTPNDEGGIAF